MNKVLNFMRSMRFGIILLLLTALCSVAGSIIPQGREIAWYAQNYTEYHGIIMALQLDDIFSSWYFVILMILLGLNLTLCSIVRITTIVKSGKRLIPDTAKRRSTIALTEKGIAVLEEHLKMRRCKLNKVGETRVYSKNLFGRYGSFITHLSILLVLVFGAAGLYMPQVTDKDCMPGESVIMPDGTEIAVHSFYIENESGQLDFTSDISVILSNGKSREGTIRVNYPLSNGPYKIYQQTYGTAANIKVTNLDNNAADSFVMTEPAFLSADGVNGLWFLVLYPDYYTNPDGSISPVQSTYGRYENPIYYVQVCENGINAPELLLPGEKITLGNLEYSIESPVEYPGLRIKYTPPAINTLLFLSFGLMIIGLYITFFMQPVLVKVDEEGCAVGGPKPEGTLIELQALLKNYTKGETT